MPKQLARKTTEWTQTAGGGLLGSSILFGESAKQGEGVVYHTLIHQICSSNAGGGGERVLWAAIKATQNRYPQAVCVVYTGDHDVTKADILGRVKVGKPSIRGERLFPSMMRVDVIAESL